MEREIGGRDAAIRLERLGDRCRARHADDLPLVAGALGAGVLGAGALGGGRRRRRALAGRAREALEVELDRRAAIDDGGAGSRRDFLEGDGRLGGPRGVEIERHDDAARLQQRQRPCEHGHAAN